MSLTSSEAPQGPWTNPKRGIGAVACVVGLTTLAFFLWTFSNPAELNARPASLEVERDAACVIEVAGTVVCWGEAVDASRASIPGPDLLAGQGPYRVPGISAATEIALDFLGACALLDQGSVVCWEWQPVLQRGVGYRYLRGTAGTDAVDGSLFYPDLQDIVSISGGESICAQQSTGVVFCNAVERDNEFVNGFSEIPGVFGAERVVAGVDAICGHYLDLTVRCVDSSDAGPASESPPVLSGVQWIDRTSPKGDVEGWCVLFVEGDPLCTWDWPTPFAQFAVPQLDGASVAFEVGDIMCGVFGAEIGCIEQFRFDGVEQVLEPRQGFADVVAGEPGRGWACVSERSGRVQCMGKQGNTLGDAAFTRMSDAPVVVARSTVPHRTRWLVYGLCVGVALLGARSVLRGSKSVHLD